MDEKDGAKTLEDGTLVEIEESMETREIVEDEGTKESTEAKKKANVPAIVFGVLALVFAGVAAFFGVEYFMGKPIEQPSGSVATPDNGSGSGENQLVTDMGAEKTSVNMAKEYKEVYDLLDGLVGDSVGIRRGYIRPADGIAYKPEGMNTYIPTRISLKANSLSNDSWDESEIVARLENAGFTSVGLVPFFGSAGPKIEGYVNYDSDIVCNMEGEKDSDIYCAKTSWSWLTDEEQKMIRGLEAAYYNRMGHYPSTMYRFDDVRMKDSEYESYQNLEIGLGGGVGLFYRTSPEAEWQYFTVTQGVIDCTDSDTEELKKAFLGETCYDYSAQQNSTVQL